MAYYLYKGYSINNCINAKENQKDEHNFINLFSKKDIFNEDTLYIFQNEALFEQIKKKLVLEYNKVILNIKNTLPQEAIEKIMKKLNQKNILFSNEIKFLLYFILKENKTYTAEETYELAQVFSNLFEEYSMNHQKEWIDFLKSSIDVKEDDFNDRGIGAAKQKILWNKIKKYNLGSFIEELDGSNFKMDQMPFNRIVLVGSLFLSKQASLFFKKISEYVDVYHFLLLPSRGLDWIHQGKEKTEHTFLKNNSLFYKMIYDKEGNNFYDSFKENTSTNFDYTIKNTLLSKLQISLIEAKKPNILFKDLKDNTFSVHKMHSTARQIEFVRDTMITLLQEDKELKLHEIALISPNPRELEPYILKYFTPESFPFIKKDHKVMEKSYFSGIGLLLNLFKNDWNRKDVLDFLNNALIMQSLKYNQEDLDIFINFINATNIYWGFDSDHKKALELGDKQSNSWVMAFERFFLGQYYDHNTINFKNQSYAPVSALSIKDESIVSFFIYNIKKLYEDIDSLKKKQIPFKEWCDSFEVFFEQYLGEEEENEKETNLILKPVLLKLKALFREIEDKFKNIKQNDHKFIENIGIQSLTFDYFFLFLKDYIQDKIEKSSNNLQYEFTLGSVVSLRSLEFKVIFIINFNEDAFPAQPKNYSFDLRNVFLKDKEEGIFSEKLDRFIFLEMLLNAKDKLYLCYKGYDEYSHRVLNPSLVLQELLSFMQSSLDPSIVMDLKEFEKIIIQEHSLYLFNAIKDNILQSYDEKTFAIAKNLLDKKAIKNKDQSKNYDYPINIFPKKENKFIEISKLKNLFKNTFKFFVQHSLNLYTSEDDDQEFMIDENYTIEAYEPSNIFKNLLREYIINPTIEKNLVQEALHSFLLNGKVYDSIFTNIESLKLDRLKNLKEKLGQYAGLKPIIIELSQDHTLKSFKKKGSDAYYFPSLILKNENTIDAYNIFGSLGELYYKDENIYYFTYKEKKANRIVEIFLPFLLFKFILKNAQAPEGFNFKEIKGIYFDEKKEEFKEFFKLSLETNFKEEDLLKDLTWYLGHIMQNPFVLYGNFWEYVFTKGIKDAESFQKSEENIKSFLSSEEQLTKKNEYDYGVNWRDCEYRKSFLTEYPPIIASDIEKIASFAMKLKPIFTLKKD